MRRAFGQVPGRARRRSRRLSVAPVAARVPRHQAVGDERPIGFDHRRKRGLLQPDGRGRRGRPAVTAGERVPRAARRRPLGHHLQQDAGVVRRIGVEDRHVGAEERACRAFGEEVPDESAWMAAGGELVEIAHAVAVGIRRCVIEQRVESREALPRIGHAVAVRVAIRLGRERHVREGPRVVRQQIVDLTAENGCGQDRRARHAAQRDGRAGLPARREGIEQARDERRADAGARVRLDRR